jgi:hypothetical protein
MPEIKDACALRNEWDRQRRDYLTGLLYPSTSHPASTSQQSISHNTDPVARRPLRSSHGGMCSALRPHPAFA